MAAVPSQGRASAPAVSPAAEAVRRLYETHRRRVLGYCLVFLRNREEAEDAVQTTFLDAFRALERGVVPEVEEAWLLAVARNVCLARRRKRGRRSELETLHDPLTLQDAWAAPEPPDGLDGVEEALARLPEAQRRAILLREWRGFSYREIAAELGISGAAVETLIFRARRSLARELDPDRASGARSRLRGLALGPFAGLKSLLGGGTAAKLAAAAATVAVVASAGGDAPRRVDAQGPAPRPAAAAPAPARAPVVARDEVREHASLVVRKIAPAPSRRPLKPKRAGQEAPASEPGEIVGGGEPLAPVTDAVEDAASSLGVEVPALPVEPPVEVPELPVELPPPPLELPLPDLPLP